MSYYLKPADNTSASFWRKFSEMTLNQSAGEEKVKEKELEEEKVKEKELEEEKVKEKELEKKKFGCALDADRIKVVRDVHNDDVHAIIPAGKSFISGSKDGCLKKWSHDGNFERSVKKNSAIDYRYWITALTNFDQGRWISGTRNGDIDLWDNDGNHLMALESQPGLFERSKTSKQRNLNRVNYLAAHVFEQNKIHYFAGRPSHVTIYSLDEAGKQELVGFFKTHNNDWAHCIYPFSLKKILAVTGDRLELWQENRQKSWKLITTYIDPKVQYMGPDTRPFISGLIPLLHDPEKSFGLSIFGGRVTSLDVETGKIFFDSYEHKGRVWMVENIAQYVLASCADDRTVKIWDVRAKNSQMTLGDHVGRVSTLLFLNGTTIVAGSCPDNLKEVEDRAQFTFWDIRFPKG